MLDALEFIRPSGTGAGTGSRRPVVVKRGEEKARCPIDIDAFASDMWSKTLRDKRRPGMLARRHLEVCVFSHLAAELRPGISRWPVRTPTPTCTPR